MSKQENRICVIGAGPSGMCALYQFGQRIPRPKIVCYEKQGTWGGLWNLTWRTGTDEFGEPCHSGMYKHLWTNGPKEAFEYPDYTYEDHYGKALPSFPPRDIFREYMEGRWKSSKTNLREMIKFNHVVRYVRYDKVKDEFIVTVKDLLTEKNSDETFSHVIVATGIYNVPNVPYFPGIESFPGRVLHSHDFRDAGQFKGQRLLVVGASYSAEDIALQCIKFGAKHVVCSWRSKPMGFIWPEAIEERPLVATIEHNSAFFKDGSTGEFDAIVFSTGYKYHFPFMEDDLRLVSLNNLYPDNLYKGILMTKGGNNKCFYIGTLDQYYSITMFDVQALWVCRYIEGNLSGQPKSPEEMRKDMNKWIQRLSTHKDCYDQIDYQTEYLTELCHVTGYNPVILKAADLYRSYEDYRAENISTYKDRCFPSLFTGKVSPKPKRPWIENFDDSNEDFLA